MIDQGAVFIHNKTLGYVEVKYPDRPDLSPVFHENMFWRRVNGKSITYAQRAAMKE